MDINLKSWHTVTVCGMKGTGKTELEKFLLQRYESIYIFDTNGEFPEFAPRTYEPETDSPKELDKVAKVIWNKGNTLLLVSEAELYLPVNGTLPPNIFKIITRGRHRNIGLIVDTRRIANLNKTVFGLSEHQFIFRHFSPTDLDYLKGFVPGNVKELASLEDYWFWHVSRGKAQVCSPIPLLKKASTASKRVLKRKASEQTPERKKRKQKAEVVTSRD